MPCGLDAVDRLRDVIVIENREKLVDRLLAVRGPGWM
jgi:hypothetical protein